jgi:arylsulfatase A-like enzyme
MFGFVFYTDPHAPYESPPPLPRRFDPEWPDDPVVAWDLKTQNFPDSASLHNMVAQYDAALLYWDGQLRALADSLASRNAWDNTLLVYTSDHGEEFAEHDNLGHGHALFEESVRVPLLFSLPPPVRFPRLPRTSRIVDDVVSSVDILPTLLEYLHLPRHFGMRGRSAMAPALGHPEDGEERMAHLELVLNRYGRFDIRALRTADRKLIDVRRWRAPRLGTPPPGRMLFDMESDPAERVNLIDLRPEETDALWEVMTSRVTPVPVGAPERPVQLDPAHLERLRALGYIE